MPFPAISPVGGAIDQIQPQGRVNPGDRAQEAMSGSGKEPPFETTHRRYDGIYQVSRPRSVERLPDAGAFGSRTPAT